MFKSQRSLVFSSLAFTLVASSAPGTALATNFLWNSGDFVTGVTTSEPLGVLDTLEIGAGGTKRFVGSTLTNLGTVRWLADPVQGGSGAAVSNAGLWQSESDANSLTWNFGGQPTFINTGTFAKSAGAITNVGSWLFRNDGGLIAAQVGAIVFDSASNVFNTGSRFSGAGQVQILGTATFNGNFQSDNLTFTGGTQVGNAAVLQGGAGLSTGLLGWSGGDLFGSWTISAATTVTGSGLATKRQVGSTIVNNGTFRWATTSQLQGGNSSSFTNNALTEVTESALFEWNFGGQAVFTNSASGTVRATNNATLTFGSVALTSNGGLFAATAGSHIDYIGASNRFNDGTRFLGNNRVTGTARFVDQIQSDDLHFVSGTQTGGDGTPGSRAHLTGLVHFEGGDLNGAWEIKSGTTLTGSGAGTKRQVGSDIINNGTFRWATTSELQGGVGSAFTNNALTEVTESATFQWNFGGQHVFTNSASGTVRATNNATLTFGSVALNSNGGLFEATAGSHIDYAGASNRFNDGTRFLGNNRITGSARLVDQIQADDLHFVSGTQTGGDGTPGSRAHLAGLVNFESGDLNGAWEIQNGTTFTGSGAGSKRQVGSDIVNNGTFRWATTAELQGGVSSSFTNNALTEATESATFQWNFGGQHVFTNSASGTVRATNNATLTFGSVALTSNGGLFEATAGSHIDYAGSSNRFNDGTRFLGNNRITGNARFVDHVQADDLHFVNGTQTGGDGTAGSTGSLGGTIGWEAGDLNGEFEIRSGATMTGTGAGSKRLLGAKLTNNGTLQWASNADLQGGINSQLVNNGRLDVSTDADLTWAFGGQASLDNAGLLRKSGGTDITSLSSLALSNTGTIDVESGAIGLPTNFVNAGTLKGTGAFNLAGTLFNDGHVAPGASPGTLTINGAYQQSALGTLDIELQNLGLSDLLAINGNATLAGTLGLSCFANCSFAVGTEIVILDATGQLTGTFSNLVMSGFGSGAFDVIYDSLDARVLLRVTEFVSAPVPLPPTTGLLLSGLGALGWLSVRRQARRRA